MRVNCLLRRRESASRGRGKAFFSLWVRSESRSRLWSGFSAEAVPCGTGEIRMRVNCLLRRRESASRGRGKAFFSLWVRSESRSRLWSGFSAEAVPCGTGEIRMRVNCLLRRRESASRGRGKAFFSLWVRSESRSRLWSGFSAEAVPCGTGENRRRVNCLLRRRESASRGNAQRRRCDSFSGWW